MGAQPTLPRVQSLSSGPSPSFLFVFAHSFLYLQSTMDQGKKVWAPDLVQGFILGEIVDFGTDVIMIQPLTGGAVRPPSPQHHSPLHVHPPAPYMCSPFVQHS
jgi:hypothetical protein